MPGVSFASTWEIGISSTGVREFGTVTSLAGGGDLGVRASIADVWKNWVETPLADVCKIGIETSLVGVGGFGVKTSITDVCWVWIEAPLTDAEGLGVGTSVLRIGAAMSLAGSWNGAQASAACHVIGTEGLSPLVIEMGVPYNATSQWLGILYIKHIGSRFKSEPTSSAFSPTLSISNAVPSKGCCLGSVHSCSHEYFASLAQIFALHSVTLFADFSSAKTVMVSTNPEFAIHFLEILFYARLFGKCFVFTAQYT